MIGPKAAHTSDYQYFKLEVLDQLDISRDAAHICIGFACLLLVLLVTRRPLGSLRVLWLGFAVSLLLEVFDLRDDLAWLGHFRWAASLHDIVLTNLLPLLLVLFARFGWIRLR